MNRNPLLPILGLFAMLSGCLHKSQGPPPLFQLQENTGIDFTNKVTNTDSANIINYRNFYNGGGVAIGDINNDGLPDIFLTSNMGANKLYLNEGNWHFRDISQTAGFSPNKEQWSTGVVMADVNGDGWLDIYVCNAGHMENGRLRENQLFINDRHGKFLDSAREYGLADSGYTTQASFFDYDGDGDLDCFLINNSPMVNTLDYVNQRQITGIPQNATGGGDHLFRNDNGHFTEVTREAGIHGSLISLGLGVTVGDINGDGYPDIYVSNDFFERDYLYINQRNGTFRDELESRMQHISLASMGADMADIDNDGYPDIFTTDMLPEDDYRLKTTFSFENEDVYRIKQQAGFYHQFFQNTLQLNDHAGGFRDIACYAGVNATDWSWGGLLFDMDNDGYNDIFVTNGIAQDLINQDFLDFFANNMARQMQTTGKKIDVRTLLEKIPSQPLFHKAFHNDGHLHFNDMAQSWGFNQASFANGAAYGDLDNDGDLDLVINNVNQPAAIYRNNSREQNHNHFLAVTLSGNGKNRFAVGARIRAYRKSEIFFREVMPVRGFQSSVDYRQLIGLGPNPSIDSLVIQWPNGATTVIDTPPVDRYLTLTQPKTTNPQPTIANPRSEKPTTANPTPAHPTPGNTTPALLTPVTAGFQRHEEDDYIDFYTEHNLPKMLSRQGPKAAVADINGDGLDDLYIGGTIGHPGQIYLQTAGEKWIKKDEPAFAPFSDFEDGAALFFDANGDGHPDLFLAPGGNIALPYSRQLQFRLFINDGKGNFHLDADAFPANANNSNSSTAIAGDFNNDGHPDLFIGGLCISREYGATPRSYLFINDGNGHFKDIAATNNPDIANIGMVTGATWTRLTPGAGNTLVIVGDWLAPHLFSWQDQHFKEIPSNLSTLSGWYNCVTAADLNGDGLTDLVFGNLGQNFYLHPDKDHPVKLWISDFDGNGIIDKILTRTVDGKDMPVFLKKDMETQLPALKKQNLKYSEFAAKSIQQLLPGAALDSATVRLLDFPASIVAFNKGNGQFDIRPLPATTQFSTVNAIHAIDIDGNGATDLVLGGNEFGFLPQLGRLDASKGQVLLNDGKGELTDPGLERTGLNLPGQTRDIVRLRGKDHLYLLFLQNDELPQLYRLP